MRSARRLSRAVVPSKSKIDDFNKSAYYFEKIYRSNEENLEPLYNLIIVSLKSKRFSNLNNILKKVYLKNKNDVKIIEGLAKTNFFLGNLSKATFFYEELIKFNSSFFEGWTKFLGSINYHQKVKQGDIIGSVGSTGRSTGPHLDFRINWFQTRLDPMTVLN